MKLLYALLVSVCVLNASAAAAESIQYSYDALGRLTFVAHNGSINNGVQETYQYDPAGNRSSVSVVGSSGAAQPQSSGRVVVMPLIGFYVMPLPGS